MTPSAVQRIDAPGVVSTGSGPNSIAAVRALRARCIVLALLVGALGLAACAPRASGPYQTPSQEHRNPLLAQELTRRALEHMDTDPDRAEKLLREALTADLYHGPAHNNLGVLFLARGQLYEAAAEFEWARKLMPGHPDPRLNLALTLETAGRTDEAIAGYRAALETHPGHLPTVQALTRLQLRAGRADHSTTEHLRLIALEGETPEWRAWAQQWRVRGLPGDLERGRPRTGPDSP